jgi:23S rRNA (adenine2503-C2)-methyltransferase
MMEKIPLLDLSLIRLKEYLHEQGWSPAHAERIMWWIYRKLSTDFEEMTDLPSNLKGKLSESANLITLKPLKEKISSDGQTRKMLFELEDGKTIETSLMVFDKSGNSRVRKTICISSQVGCPIGCRFCATGQQGFERNLRTGEILEQILFFWRTVRADIEHNRSVAPPSRITNVVFMGMGEPLANYENVRQAIEILNSPRGLGLGIRQITLSTAGLVPFIRQMAGDNLQAELAVSLHAATDELRSRLVPINKKYNLSQLISACDDYANIKKCRIFYEYALFDGINDTDKDALDLVNLLRGQNCSVNLILANATSNMQFQASTREHAMQFQKTVIEGGIRCMTRASKGADIAAGCGQLKSRYLAKGAEV